MPVRGGDLPQGQSVPGGVEVDGSTAWPMIEAHAEADELFDHLLEAQPRRLMSRQTWVVQAELGVVPGPQLQHSCTRRMHPPVALRFQGVRPQRAGGRGRVLAEQDVEVADLLLGERVVGQVALGAVEELPEAEGLFGEVVGGGAVAVGDVGDRGGGPVHDVGPQQPLEVAGVRGLAGVTVTGASSTRGHGAISAATARTSSSRVGGRGPPRGRGRRGRVCGTPRRPGPLGHRRDP